MNKKLIIASILAVAACSCFVGQAFAQEFVPNLSREEQHALMGDEVPMEVIQMAADHGKAVRNSRVMTSRMRDKKQGALQGKRISLSPGHGIEPGSPWGFQRSPGKGIREDKHTYEWVSEFLRPMLERAGAETLMMRAYSFTESSVLVTNQPSDNYVETGTWEASSYGDYRFAYVTPEETATATWSFKVEKDGDYPVYVRYYTSDNRVKDAQFSITHARGESVVLQNMNMKGIKSGANNGSDVTNNSQRASTNYWHYLGTFPFRASETGKVTLSNKSSENSENVVIADSVQVGDGPGVYKASGGSVSGYFKWQESAQTWFKTLGLPDWVSFSDVKGRSLYSLFEGVDAQVSLHTNAGTGSSRGTQTYVWYFANSAGDLQWITEDEWSSSFVKDNLPPGTYEYATHIHKRFFDYMNTYVKSDWAGYKKLWSACFGELSPARNAWYNNKNNSPIIIPSVLIETAFHDNDADAKLIRDLSFRFYGARAIMAGIIQYFKGDDNAVIPPLPPEKLTVVAEKDHLSLSWSPVKDKVLSNSDPTSYNIYTSDDGVLFDVDPMMNVTDTKVDLPISLGQTLYVRVTAVNAGGESLDSIAGVGKLPSNGQKKILYVDGVDRGTKNYYDANTLRSFARIYAPAILFNYPGSGIDFADDEAVAELLKSHQYDAVVWATGETGTSQDVISAEQKNAIKSLRSKQVPLLISGSNIGYSMSDTGYNSDASWLSQTFHAGYIADNAFESDATDQSFTASDIVSGTIVYSSCVADGGKVSNRSKDAICVHDADVLSADNGATVLMNYAGCIQTSCGAAVLSSDKKSILVGFPLESIADSDKRLCTIANLLSKLNGDAMNTSCTPAIWSPPAEVCGNGLDDDENGLADCADPACKDLNECKPVEPEPQVTEEICGNGVDDDGNGLKDCDDLVCKELDECKSEDPNQPVAEEICGNGVDDDGNGLADCADSACKDLDECKEDKPENPQDPDEDEPDDGDDEHIAISSDSDCSIHSGTNSGSAAAWMLGLLGVLSLRRRKFATHK